MKETTKKNIKETIEALAIRIVVLISIITIVLAVYFLFCIIRNSIMAKEMDYGLKFALCLICNLLFCGTFLIFKYRKNKKEESNEYLRKRRKDERMMSMVDEYLNEIVPNASWETIKNKKEELRDSLEEHFHLDEYCIWMLRDKDGRRFEEHTRVAKKYKRD